MLDINDAIILNCAIQGGAMGAVAIRANGQKVVRMVIALEAPAHLTQNQRHDPRGG